MTVFHGQSRLSQPQTIRNRRVTPSACLTGYTLKLGEVDTGDCGHLPTRWLIAAGAVSE